MLGPLVSVTVTTHIPEPPYLAAALASIRAQTYTNWEITLVVDGAKLAAPQDLGPDVRLVEVPKGGLSRARNYGLGYARGELVCFFDHDDVYLPRHLEAAVERLSKAPDAVASYSSFETVNSRGEHLDTVTVSPCDRRSVLSGGSRPWVGAMVARRWAASAVGGFDSQFDGAEDIGFIYKLTNLGPFVDISEVTMQHRRHEANVSNNTRAMAAALDAVLAHERTKALESHDAQTARYVREAQRISSHYYAGVAISDAKQSLQAGDYRAALRSWAWALGRSPAEFSARATGRLKRSPLPAASANRP